MKLWTVQPLSILDEIKETGTYRCRRELSFNLTKQDSLEDKYQWLIDQMEQRIGQCPQNVKYPIWAWHTWKGERVCPDTESAAFLKRREDKVLCTLEVPDDQVVLTDFDSWQYVLNNGYVPSRLDLQHFEERQAYLDSISDEELQNEIVNSWRNVFDIQPLPTEGGQRGYYIQATFWQIKKDYLLAAKPIYQNAAEKESNG